MEQNTGSVGDGSVTLFPFGQNQQQLPQQLPQPQQPLPSFDSRRPIALFTLNTTQRQKLMNHGFKYGSDFDGMSPSMLAKGFKIMKNLWNFIVYSHFVEIGVSHGEALEILKVVHEGEKKTQVLGKSALEMLKIEPNRMPIFTLNKDLDEMLGGGVQLGKLTEFCGVPGIGKTQMG